MLAKTTNKKKPRGLLDEFDGKSQAVKDGILALTRPGARSERRQLGSLNQPKNIRTWGHPELGRHQECGQERETVWRGGAGWGGGGGWRAALGITGAPRCQLLDASQQADGEARTAVREQRCARSTGLAWALFTRPGSRTPGVRQVDTHACPLSSSAGTAPQGGSLLGLFRRLLATLLTYRK